MKRAAAIGILLIMVIIGGVWLDQAASEQLSREEALGVLLLKEALPFFEPLAEEQAAFTIEDITVAYAAKKQQHSYIRVGYVNEVADSPKDYVYFAADGTDPLYLKLDAADDIVTVKKRNQMLFAVAEEKIEVDLALVRQNLSLDEKCLLKCLNIREIEYFYHGREIKNIKR